MTTTPATTDLDAIRARFELTDVQCGNATEYLNRLYASSRDVPALLDELATERRQGAAMASITGEAIRQIGEERDAAREELAKLRDRLTEAEAVIINAQDALTTDHPVFWVLDDYDGSMDSVQTLKRERDAVRGELAKTSAELDAMTGVAKALRITVAEMLSGKQHTRARTLTWESTLKYATEALANPATTAEPAAKADIIAEPPTQHFVDDADLALLAATDTTAEPADEDAEDAPCKSCGKPWRNRRHECQAEPADEPKATVDLADPNACRHCGINDQDHANRWTETVGWHTWVDPGDEVRKTRMLLRRQAKAEPAAS